MRLKTIIVTLLVAIVLAACSSNSNEETKNNQEVDIKKIVQDYSTDEITAQSASITSEQLIVTDNNGDESTYSLPEDEFFVSIAPFINETHPCTNHSLTGCQGELVNKDFEIYIEDMDGNVIFDETKNSGSNGFVDLWLPREKTYRVKINYEGKQVESEVSTFENDGTCITTMKLT
ncbi:CueP family metal-binding protein [Salinibacillus aidingensis]|uniref:CueP family metal-binding protein n=1 Tax=Salinibacillus aidingensis TaxID=237684 RepID=A0ABN1BH97_9BACI